MVVNALGWPGAQQVRTCGIVATVRAWSSHTDLLNLLPRGAFAVFEFARHRAAYLKFTSRRAFRPASDLAVDRNNT